MRIENKCIFRDDSGRIKVEELKRKAVFKNAARVEFIKVQVDGCAIKGRKAADWLVERDGVGQIIVELKGKNVEQGVKQVLETADFWKKNKLRQGKLAGLIVCSQYPQVDTAVQKAKQSFATRHKAQLHVVCGNREYVFENVFKATGALKSK